MKKVYLASSLVFVCVLGLAGCSSSDNTGGGTGGSGANGGSGSGGSGESSKVTCDMETWVGGSAPCAGTWTTCSDGKDYGFTCSETSCNCQVNDVTTKTVNVGSMCSPTTSDDALPAIAQACGFPL